MSIATQVQTCEAVDLNKCRVLLKLNYILLEKKNVLKESPMVPENRNWMYKTTKHQTLEALMQFRILKQ